MGIGKLINTWSILIILLMSTGIVLMNEETTGENISNTTRIYLEKEKEGGEWYDDFSDSSGISSQDGTLLEKGEVHPGRVVYSEDFESYTNNQNIVGSNGWTQHTNNNKGTFLCDTSKPFSSKTPKVGNHFNDQDFAISSFLSGTFLVTQGTYELWVMTSKIDSTYTTTSMNLVGKTGDNPVAEDRILAVQFSQGGFGCRGSAGTWEVLNADVMANTWYRVSVDFDCATQSCDVFLYSASGTLLGSKINVGFQFPQTSAKRLMLSSNTRSYDTRSYWDDIRIIDRSGTGSVISNEIDLPNGKLWTTLSLDKNEPGSSRIELEILDDSDEPITSVVYDNSASEIDISGLNPGVKAIKLKANLISPGSALPTLNGWGVEWDATNTWRDSFQTSLRTEYLSGVMIDHGDVMLVPGQINGVYESEPITLPTNSYWETMKVNMSSTSYSRISFDILDYSTESSIPGYSDLWSRNGLLLDMLNIDPIAYPVIRIRARLNQEDYVEPIIHSISISWIGNMFPSIHGFNVTPVLMRTESTRISFGVSDTEQSPRELDASFDYLTPSGTEWISSMCTDLVYNTSSSTYECDLITDTASPVGVYFLRVTVTDEMGASRVMVYDDRLEVKNNIPTKPTIILGPENPTTRSEITATIVDPGYDIERPNLVFSYTFYINGLEDTESKKIDLPAEAVPYLPGSRTKKGDVISCIVIGSDGLNDSESYSASIMIMNTPPEMMVDHVDYVDLDEDTADDTQLKLKEITYDIDGDDITFSSPGSGNITIEIDDSTGWVNFIPGPDFFGEENVTFIASDGEDETYFQIKAYVKAVNDIPTGSIISPSSNIDVELEAIVTFSALGNDTESDPEDLIYAWQIGDGVIAQGPDFSMNWTEVGERNVSCFISDGDEKAYIGSVIINVFKPDPPYSSEEVGRNYTGSDPPVIFDVEDAFGNGVMARYGDNPSIDLRNLTVELDDYNMNIILELGGTPLSPDSRDPFTSGDGRWAYYRIYFVSEIWSEDEFIQSSLNLNKANLYSPTGLRLRNTGWEPHTLTYGTGGIYGSPVVEGNNIIWTLDTRTLAESGLLIEDMQLWGSVKYIEVEEELMIGGYDTIGHGSQAHLVVEEKVIIEEEEEGGISPVLVVFMILLILIIIGLVIALILSRKGDKSKEEDPEGQEEGKPEEKTEEPDTTAPALSAPQPPTAQNLPKPTSNALPPAAVPGQAATTPLPNPPQMKAAPAPVVPQQQPMAQVPTPAQQPATPAAQVAQPPHNISQT